MTTTTQGVGKSGLQKDALSLLDVLITGLSETAPAFSIVFVSTVLVTQVGAQIPLVMLVTMFGILATANSLAQFAKLYPSAGSYVTFVARSIGSKTALFVAVCGIIGGVLLIGGQFMFLAQYFVTDILGDPNVPYLAQILTIVIAILVVTPVLLGAALGARTMLVLYVFEVGVLLILSAVVLAHGGVDGLSLAPFTLGENTVQGIALGMSLGVLAFIGFEASVPLAEESRNPRRNVPAALLAGVTISGIIYVLGSYALVEGLGVEGLKGAAAPFIDLAKLYLPASVIFVTWMVVTSTGASMIATATQFGRIIYNSAREGLFPRSLATTNPRFKTPWAATAAFATPAATIMLVWTFFWDPLTVSGWWSSLGSLSVIVMYLAVNLALIRHWFALRAQEGSRHWIAWLVVPVIGILVMAYPIWGLLQPGQSSPYDILGIGFIGVLVMAGTYVLYVRTTRSNLLQNAGSIIMGEYHPDSETSGRAPGTQ